MNEKKEKKSYRPKSILMRYQISNLDFSNKLISQNRTHSEFFVSYDFFFRNFISFLFFLFESIKNEFRN